MSYVAAADFRERTLKPWATNLLLTEADGTDAYIDLVIAGATTQVELDLGDDFEPAGGDPDETLEVDGAGRTRLYTPRRVRSLTTVKTRAIDGTLTTQDTTVWRLHKSLDAAGTGMLDGSKLDWLDYLNDDTTWPEGTQTVQLVGKFGWAAVPTDIKRLVALRTYELIRATGDPLTTVVQRTTVDSVMTFGPSVEETEIVDRYRRNLVVLIG